MKQEKKGTVLLCILDGVGVGPNDKTNAIHIANTPTLDRLNSQHPHANLRSDGEFVGVPAGQMGNSEIGHITIGTGRVVQQSLVKISADLDNKQFQKKSAYKKFLNKSENSRVIHLIGLLSDGGIHSHIEHAICLCKSLNKLNQPILVHAITDGRDTAVNAGISQIQEFQNRIQNLENVKLVSIIGRYYAMDRDNRWDRIEIAWNMFTKGTGTEYSSVSEALQSGYNDGLSDEHIKPSLISLSGDLDSTIQDGDSVFLYNFRGDRMRQITRCFLGLKGIDFKCSTPNLHSVATMTLYDIEFKQDACVIYPSETCKNTLGEVVSLAGLKQLRIAETEKYAHVTFFFNNGREKPFDLENRVLIPSPRDVATYDLKPEMSLPELTHQLVNTIQANDYDLIVLNIANADMVGHTGNFNAAVKAVEYIDEALKKIIAAIDQVNGEILIIADHGNIEQMSIHGKPSTTHTLNPVPCIYYGKRDLGLRNGSLSDVAPTILAMLDLDAPEQMTGKSLFK
ncbi:MAG: 2,3-bisphosphoglycerate-independent phosphoglycerate mutase [Immundisolibacteraceae bacterium]|nr:2,3-bisphosphoglycerate-independent phosphoglycerate mutase [Immundisolibacteraceae bacterium]